MRHFPFRALTFEVFRSSVDRAMSMLRKRMQDDRVFEKIRQHRRYIKPTYLRRQKLLESANRIYGQELYRKIQFAREFYNRELRFKA